MAAKKATTKAADTEKKPVKKKLTPEERLDLLEKLRKVDKLFEKLCKEDKLFKD